MFFKAPRYLFRKVRILEFLEKEQFDNFLDVGCGAGELACSIVQQMKTKGLGIDFSEDAIAIARDLSKKRNIPSSDLSFESKELHELNEKFELVICCEVLEHVENDAKLLQELLTKTTRFLLISVPAKMKLFDQSDESVGHYRRYERKELIALLKQNGIKDYTLINYGYPFTNIVRLIRKAAFVKRNATKKNDAMEDKSKDSGINPVKSRLLSNTDLEPTIRLLSWVSKKFEKYDLGEGYLIFCKVKD